MNFTLWKQQFEKEQARLIELLGKVTEGGLLEDIQHIGATSVPGLQGSACVDIGLAVWPFPLEEGPKAGLEEMGYRVVEGVTGSPQQRFLHVSEDVQLLVFESGVGAWFDHVLISEYLRHSDRTCAEVSKEKKDPLTDKSALFTELLPLRIDGGQTLKGYFQTWSWNAVPGCTGRLWPPYPGMTGSGNWCLDGFGNCSC